VGENPFDEFLASKNEMTFRDLFNIYIDRHAKKKQKKTVDEMLRSFDRWLLPMAKRKPSSITHADAEHLHWQIAKQEANMQLIEQFN